MYRYLNHFLDEIWPRFLHSQFSLFNNTTEVIEWNCLYDRRWHPNEKPERKVGWKQTYFMSLQINSLPIDSKSNLVLEIYVFSPRQLYCLLREMVRRGWIPQWDEYILMDPARQDPCLRRKRWNSLYSLQLQNQWSRWWADIQRNIVQTT